MSLDLIDYKRIACQRALDISVEAAPRGYMPLDLYAALAQIVADRNPQLALECLRALEMVCTARKNVMPDQNAQSSLIIQ